MHLMLVYKHSARHLVTVLDSTL